jgi:hypothetical protein
MTVDEAIASFAKQLDGLIDGRLQALEAQIRHDIAITGPEDEDALDRPPEPDAPWRRVTPEEVVEAERARLQVWRGMELAKLRRTLEAW